MSRMADGFEIVELPYALVFDPVRRRIKCPYCLLVVPGIFAQGDIYRCPNCRVYWIRWLDSLFGAVWIDELGVVSIGLREIENVYAGRCGELWRAA